MTSYIDIVLLPGLAHHQPPSGTLKGEVRVPL